MKPELHLFIIWNKAEYFKKQIFDDITKDLEVLKIVTIVWNKRNFSENLLRFYGKKLYSCTARIAKENDCGRGPFTLILVRDPNPIYELRRTSRGKEELVNIHMFDRKLKYRGWIGNNTSKIHSTNNTMETEHDLMLLLGITPKQFVQEPNKISNIHRSDIIGSNGWESLEQLFMVLNLTIPYVVLRNYEYLPNQFASQSHGDIDLLVPDIYEAMALLNAKKVYRQNYRVHCECLIASKSVRFDFRYVGDQYYCKEWEQNILDTRQFSAGGFYIPNAENYKYSLLYHALLQKPQLSNEYRDKLIILFPKKEINIDLLSEFMNKKGYSYIEPVDLSVYFNHNAANVDLSIRRRQYLRYVELKKKIKTRVKLR